MIIAYFVTVVSKLFFAQILFITFLVLFQTIFTLAPLALRLLPQEQRNHHHQRQVHLMGLHLCILEELLF
jgi:hypothetical protein